MGNKHLRKTAHRSMFHPHLDWAEEPNGIRLSRRCPLCCTYVDWEVIPWDRLRGALKRKDKADA